MYQPAHFKEDDPAILREFIRRHPFALLVSTAEGRLRADHLPMRLVNSGEEGTLALEGHVARAGALWRELSEDDEVLVVFRGADAYISPSCYPTKAATHRVVPTWNHAAVHARGRIRFFDDAVRLRAMLSALTDQQERLQTAPWRVDDAPTDYIEQLMRTIVGLEIGLTELTGKFKASQNRTPADRDGVRRALQSRSAEDLAELVRDPHDIPGNS